MFRALILLTTTTALLALDPSTSHHAPAYTEVRGGSTRAAAPVEDAEAPYKPYIQVAKGAALGAVVGVGAAGAAPVAVGALAATGAVGAGMGLAASAFVKNVKPSIKPPAMPRRRSGASARSASKQQPWISLRNPSPPEESDSPLSLVEGERPAMARPTRPAKASAHPKSSPMATAAAVTTQFVSAVTTVPAVAVAAFAPKRTHSPSPRRVARSRPRSTSVGLTAPRFNYSGAMAGIREAMRVIFNLLTYFAMFVGLLLLLP